MAEKSPQYLKQKKTPLYWDWWRENPAEVILLVFILAFFFLTPWAGCGITPAEIDPGSITVVP